MKKFKISDEVLMIICFIAIVGFMFLLMAVTTIVTRENKQNELLIVEKYKELKKLQLENDVLNAEIEVLTEELEEYRYQAARTKHCSLSSVECGDE